MNYPTEILPNTAYKYIDCDLSEHFLMRLTNTSNYDEIVDVVTGKVAIRQICSPAEGIDDLSTSLYGIYNERHINLQFTEAGREKFYCYCEPDESVAIPVYKTEFNNDGDKGYWVVEIKKLHNIAFNYPHGKDTFIATCKVAHTPTKWNFWHFSLRWETHKGPLENLEGNERRNTARKIGHAVRVVISQFATVNPPKGAHLMTQCYQKTKNGCLSVLFQNSGSSG